MALVGPSPAWGALLILEGVVRVSFARVHACPHRQVEQMGMAMAAKAREVWQQTVVLFFFADFSCLLLMVSFFVLWGVVPKKKTVVFQSCWEPFGIDVPVHLHRGNPE